MNKYASIINPANTPPSSPIPGREPEMVKNNAGGYNFKLDQWSYLDRLLLMGTEGGTYYVDERKLTLDAISNARLLIALDGPRVVARTVEVSNSGRAPRNSAAVFVLAVCSVLGDYLTKAAANRALPAVCRTGTDLFAWAESVRALSGRPPGNGAGQRRALQAWYSRPIEQVAYQLIKYRQRDGWSHRDLLRLAHVVPASPEHGLALAWAAGKSAEGGSAQIDAFIEAQSVTDKARLVQLITDHRLSWEMLPSEWLTDPAVWEALLPHMPLTAMIRNLGRMTSIGALRPLSNAAQVVTQKLSDEPAMRKARVHPITMLNAQKVYGSGSGVRGSLSWTPVQQIEGALEAAFHTAMAATNPTGQRIYLAIDGSGSMTWSGSCHGFQALKAVEVAAAMAVSIARTEARYHIAGFDTEIKNINVTANAGWQAIVKSLGYGGGTDASVPFRHAMAEKIEVDAFVVITDNEIWAGRYHPSTALNQYRQHMGIDAKMIVCSTSAVGHAFADPRDPRSMDIVGFDANAPNVITDFIMG